MGCVKMLSEILHIKIFSILNAVVPLVLSLLLILLFRNKLPKDQGRAFAVDGEKSAGKIRGAGILFVIAFVISSLLFSKFNGEYILYGVCVFISMLSGYLDDRSDKPWNEYKKGIIDLVVCALTSFLFAYSNSDLLTLGAFGFKVELPLAVYVIFGTAFLWLMINAVNCSDGIDGYSGALSLNSLIFIALILTSVSKDTSTVSMIICMIFVLLPYLWFNAESSTMMMGDAGSRALGIFIGIAIMKTGNMLLAVPLCFIFLMDGLLGIAKVSLKRFLKISIMKNIRTPIHDHLRKNKGWSNTQVIYRLNIIQAVISVIVLIAIK